MKTIKNLKAEEIRKSILQLAIQGKLVKQDPNDEPASELVKRIYAEKQRLIKEGKIKKDKNESFIFKGDDNCYYEKIGNNAPVKLEDLPFDIPDSWTWIRFPNLVNFTLGKTPERHNPKYWGDGKYPWFSIADMKDKKTVTETKEKISECSLSEYFNSCTSPAGTLIMSFKLTVGRVSILGVDAIHNEAIISIFPYLEENNTIRDWLFYTLGLIVEYVDQTDAIKGSTLNKEKMNSMLIPLPPIKEQNRIISKLLESEPLIVKYGDIENKLSLLESEFPEKLKKSILQYAIEGKLVKQDPNDEPASVLLERIKAEKEKLIKEGKIKRDKNDSYIFQGDDKNYYEKSFLKLRLGSIISVSSGSSINIRNLDYSKKYPVFGGNGIVGTYDDYLVEPNTIILGRVGANCGSVHISRQKAFVSDNALIVYPKTNFIDIDYLVWALRSINYKNMISSTAQPLISGKLLYPIEILIPSLKTQKRIVLKINRLYEVSFDAISAI